jgi:hypothetical protein
VTVPNFHDWLIAVTPRFPEFQELAAFVENATGWPDGHDEATLTTFLKRSGAPHLVTSLSRALSSFDLLCTPSAPMPDGMRLPWDWHNSALVEQTRASMKRHSRREKVSTSEYRWQLGRRLAKIMSKKTRILVDICHWIKMRDSERGKPVAKEYGQILAQLRRLVASQRYICPITAALFLELETQTDIDSRLRTARLMEELSDNVVLPELSEMEKLELRRRAFDAAFGTGALNADWKVWTKAGFLLGELWPEPATPDWLSAKDLWWVQKSYVDTMWNTPFTQIVSILDDTHSTAELRTDFSKIMNADKAARPSTDFEYERMRVSAVVIREIIVPAAYEVAVELERVARGRPGYSLPKISTSPGRDPWCLPSVQVIAGIEALIRTTNRRFHDNDMFDLLHCAAALPYCQVFFSDGPFERIIKDPKLEYDRKYGVEVLSDPRRMLSYLEKLS